MAAFHFEQFLFEATTPDHETDRPLAPDELYGLYTSWCLIHGDLPKPDLTFKVAM